MKKTAKATPSRRKQSPARQSPNGRDTILDAAEGLMIDEGYASVTARKVAARAGLSPALVQHYFGTMDELYIALYRRAADSVGRWQAEAFDAKQPLHELWRLNTDSERMTLAIEFMALANHRKAIRSEIASYYEHGRAEQVARLAPLLKDKFEQPKRYPPAAMSLLLAVIGRGLVMEEALGIHAGHEELRALVTYWLKRLS